MSLSCDPGCGELEEFVLPASTITSVKLHVDELCQPGEAGLDQVEVFGGFVEMGNTNIFHFKTSTTTKQYFNEPKFSSVTTFGN